MIKKASKKQSNQKKGKLKKKPKAKSKIAPKKALKATQMTSAFHISKKEQYTLLGLNNDVWPLERDILFRPDRLRYVRKLIKPQGCVFCQINQEELSKENLGLTKTQHSLVVVNKYPYNSGHVLVMPRRHCGSVLDLSEIEYSDLMLTLRVSMKIIEKVYSPGGMNVGLNHGAVAGAGIPDHLHFHIVPRWSGDLNFFPLIAKTKIVVESAEDSWTRLRDEFTKELTTAWLKEE